MIAKGGSMDILAFLILVLLLVGIGSHGFSDASDSKKHSVR